MIFMVECLWFEFLGGVNLVWMQLGVVSSGVAAACEVLPLLCRDGNAKHFHHFSAHPGFNVNICKVVLEQVITLWLDEDEI